VDTCRERSIIGEELIGDILGQFAQEDGYSITSCLGESYVKGAVRLAIRCKHNVTELNDVLVVKKSPFPLVLGIDWLEGSGAFIGFSGGRPTVIWPKEAPALDRIIIPVRKLEQVNRKQKGTHTVGASSHTSKAVSEYCTLPSRKESGDRDVNIPIRDWIMGPEIAVGVVANEEPIEVEEVSPQREHDSSREVRVIQLVSSRARKRIRLDPVTLTPRKKREVDLSTSSTTSKVKKMRAGLPSRLFSRCSAIVRDLIDVPQEHFYWDVNDGEFAVLPSGFLAPLEEVSPTDRPPDIVRSGGEW